MVEHSTCSRLLSHLVTLGVEDSRQMPHACQASPWDTSLVSSHMALYYLASHFHEQILFVNIAWLRSILICSLEVLELSFKNTVPQQVIGQE